MQAPVHGEEYEGLQVMFKQALKRNAQLLKDKEQVEEMQKEMQHDLQEFEKKSTVKNIIQQSKWQKDWNWGRETRTRKNMHRKQSKI